MEILVRKAAPQAVDNLAEIRAFLSEPARKRPRADRERFGHGFGSSAAVREQSLDLILDRGPHGILGGRARSRRFLTEGSQSLQEMRILSDEGNRQGLIRERDLVGPSRELDRTAEETLKILDVNRASMGAGDPDRMDIKARCLADYFDLDRESKLGVLPDPMP